MPPPPPAGAPPPEGHISPAGVRGEAGQHGDPRTAGGEQHRLLRDALPWGVPDAQAAHSPTA